MRLLLAASLVAATPAVAEDFKCLAESLETAVACQLSDACPTGAVGAQSAMQRSFALSDFYMSRQSASNGAVYSMELAGQANAEMRYSPRRITLQQLPPSPPRPASDVLSGKPAAPVASPQFALEDWMTTLAVKSGVQTTYTVRGRCVIDPARPAARPDVVD